MRVVSRQTETGIEVFDAVVESSHLFPAPGMEHGESFAVSASREFVVWTGPDAVVCVGRDGAELWRLPAPRPPKPADAAGSGFSGIALAFSTDDRTVGVFLPGDPDEWLMLDAATGKPEVRYPLPTSGAGGHRLFALADGRMLLGVTTEDDSLVLLLGAEDAVAHPENDRMLIDVAPGLDGFMTGNNDDADLDDVTFHALPDGAVIARTTAARLAAEGEDAEQCIVHWAGGYLDADTAIVVVSGEHPEHSEEWRHHRVDVRTGEVLGDLFVTTIDEYDLQALGDGTYVITDTDGTLRRM
ncbi:hypothetical protein [Actinoplanes rectilineatus]|uniref:hypothetical protein n=1 Tax=Actinoplanes rectilineatus TaxID=113571 RepID=UPI0005F28831|nr:hypothetical protein [Actinoplanes rectilineatus]